MKKLISIALSITIAVSVAMSAYIIPSHAVGYNKVVDNEFGGKTTYVATEYLDDYVQELEDEINEVGNKYRDRYHIQMLRQLTFFVKMIVSFFSTVLL